jgi:hypothetical protein
MFTRHRSALAYRRPKKERPARSNERAGEHPTPGTRHDIRHNQERTTDMENAAQHDPTPESDPPEDRPEEPGAEGGSQSPSADKLPGAPADDDAPVGDTDQHSDA